MDWGQYLNHVLENEKCLDGIEITIGDKTAEIPSMVKASVFLLEKMIKNQGQYNLFVFPGGEELLFCFMVAKLIYNIKLGKISSEYTPEDFIPGQKLKIGNAVVEFERIDTTGEKKVIRIKTAELTVFCGLEYAPFFQTVNTKRKLSTYKNYVRARDEIKEKFHNNYLDRLEDMKTHMMGSLFYISGISKSKRFADSIQIDKRPLYDYFLVGQTDYMGRVQNIKGKETGIHSIVFSSQISHMIEAVGNGAKAQSAIINISECDINDQLDALDSLIHLKIPIVCVTDTLNSFDIDELKKRRFNIWRWDERSISGVLCKRNVFDSDRKTLCCCNQKINYHEVGDCVINSAFSVLYRYRKRIEDENQLVNSIFSNLFSLVYDGIRSVIRTEYQELQKKKEILDRCSYELEREMPYMDENMVKDFQEAISLIRKTTEIDYVFPKRGMVENIIRGCRESVVFIICSNRDDTERIKKELTPICDCMHKELEVIGIRDFLNMKNANIRFAVITGWFSATVIRKIMYGYRILNVHVMLYECEKQWMNAHTKHWKIQLNSENNEIIKNESFHIYSKADELEHKVTSNSLPTLSSAEASIIDEQDDVEYVLQENKYRRYSSIKNNTEESLVEAMPVSYVGGDFSLYTRGHKILVASNIIMQFDNKVEERDTEALKAGDFVVVRESSKDIIRDVADIVLEKNNKSGIRDIAYIWKEALKIESMFSTSKEIYDRLRKVGCNRNIQTIRNWINSENIIIPQSIEDLEAIYLITEDEILHKKMQEIFDAGMYIKKAHIKAGRIISERLSESISIQLSGDNAIDPFNVWEPIEVDMDDIGVVRIYKVTDVGNRWLYVKPNDTNRVLSEEKDTELWQE